MERVIARDARRAVGTFVTLLFIAGPASLAFTLNVTWQRGLGDLWLLALAMAVLALMGVSPVVFEATSSAGQCRRTSGDPGGGSGHPRPRPSRAAESGAGDVGSRCWC